MARRLRKVREWLSARRRVPGHSGGLFLYVWSRLARAVLREPARDVATPPVTAWE